MAGADRRRIFRLPRRTDQWRGDCCISLPRRHPLAPATMPAQPEGTTGVDADGEAGGRVPSQAAYPAPLAQCAFCRQTPEVGAECPNWTRSDLCGGRSEMSVPTANTTSISSASTTVAELRNFLLMFRVDEGLQQGNIAKFS